MAYSITHFGIKLVAFLGLLDQIWGELYLSRFEQKESGRAAEFKKPFLRAFAYGMVWLKGLVNVAYTGGADFCHQYFPKLGTVYFR